MMIIFIIIDNKVDILTDTFETNDFGFDLEKAKVYAKHYSKSTGVRTLIIDFHGQTLYEYCNPADDCSFCKEIEAHLDNKHKCSSAHLYGSYQAELLGGQYIFFCPLGLTHWASPIVRNGIMKGAILAGPVHMVDPEAFMIDDIMRKQNLNKEDFKNLREKIMNIKVLSPDIVNSMAEILALTILPLSDLDAISFDEDKKFQKHQSDISSYIQHIKTIGGDDSDTTNYPIEKEKKLLSLISIGDKAGSQKILNEILGHIFFSTGKNFKLIKSRILELVVLLSRAALEGGADVEQIFGLNYKYLNQINSFITTEDLAYWLSKIMTRFTDCVFDLTNVKHIDVIYKAIEFIKKNYMKKISLDNVSDHVFLSKSYFSKIFKDELGLNYNAYINKLRIDMSKELLLHDNINLIDVSNLVGFEDQSYFSKVFKKITGSSPGKYRESKGKKIN